MQGPLKCSEAQVAAYQGAIDYATQLVFVTHAVPDSLMTPCTELLRRTVLPFCDHAAAAESGTLQSWDCARIQRTFSTALLQQAQLEAQNAPAPPAHATLWPAAPDPASGHGRSGGRGSGNRPGHAPIPVVYGITSWRGPPLRLDAEEKQRMRAEFVAAIRASRVAARKRSAGDTADAAEAARGADPPVAPRRHGGGGPPLLRQAAAPTRAASLPTSSSFGTTPRVQHMHAAAPQPPRATFSAAPSAVPESAVEPLLCPFNRGVSSQTGLGGPQNSSLPCRIHDLNALCGDTTWPLQTRNVDHGVAGMHHMQYLAPAPLSAPAGAYAATPRAHGDHLDAPPFHDPHMAYGTAAAVEGAVARVMVQSGLSGTHDGGCFAPPPVLPPNEMSKLMIGLAGQLGYPPQRMHEVLSCLQQDCMQAVNRTVSW